MAKRQFNANNIRNALLNNRFKEHNFIVGPSANKDVEVIFFDDVGQIDNSKETIDKAFTAIMYNISRCINSTKTERGSWIIRNRIELRRKENYEL